MDLEENTNYCIPDVPDPTPGIGEKFGAVTYGHPGGSFPFNAYLQGTPIVSTVTAPFGFISASPGPSTQVNVSLPARTWFLNDWTNKTLVFSSSGSPSLEMTEACTPETEITGLRAIGRFLQASQKIGRYAKYPENWDSYGAKVIDQDCIIMGTRIIGQLMHIEPFETPSPFVAPLSTGGVQMEWERGNRYLEISINPNPLSVEYFATDKAKGGQLSLEGTIKSLSFLKELISWFVNGTTEELSLISPEASDEEWAYQANTE